MAKRTINNVKLGGFIIGGLLFLVLLLYMIGKNRSLFGSYYLLKARFENVNGLVAGNNVRFSGIQAGTVKKITILNDTLIEVTMTIDTKMKNIIKKNAIVSIGTDGLVGNKVVNIVAAKQPATFAEEGDILPIKKSVDTEEMLQKLSGTNKTVAEIAEGLKTTVQRLNNSTALWNLLNDNTLPLSLRSSANNIRLATGKAGNMVDELNTIIINVKKGKGSVGALLADTSFAYNLNEAVSKIKVVGDEADVLAANLSQLVEGIQHDINNGKGTVNALLKDSGIVTKLNTSLDNIQKGTEGFNQTMGAIKSSFLFRGYFKRLEKQKKKEANQTLSPAN